jgi:translation initiation factor RLI1
VGGSWSHRFSDRLAVGLSPFFAFRGQRSRRALTLEELSGGAASASFVGLESEYNHSRLLAKAGVAWRPGRFELGATVTAPGVKLWGSGKTVFNATVAGDTANPVLSATTQKGLEANYHAPWSIAAGATWRRPRGAIHTTVEWFSSVDEYEILHPEPAPVAGSPETVPLVYRGEARRVALARALAPRPSTLLFDEPLTNLDRALREDLLQLIIESVREAGSRMLYVTHDEYEAERINGTIIRFDNGTVCREGI